MKLGHSADEIKYDETVGTIARYVVLLDGEPTMTVLCDSSDPEKVIRIARVAGPGSSAILQDTAGRFTMTTELLEDPDGNPLGTSGRVSGKSVYTYVVPRLHVLLGRLLRAAS
jgi:hypothetical protein